jgi:hypothetical protein
MRKPRKMVLVLALVGLAAAAASYAYTVSVPYIDPFNGPTTLLRLLDSMSVTAFLWLGRFHYFCDHRSLERRSVCADWIHNCDSEKREARQLAEKSATAALFLSTLRTTLPRKKTIHTSGLGPVPHLRLHVIRQVLGDSGKLLGSFI